MLPIIHDAARARSGFEEIGTEPPVGPAKVGGTDTDAPHFALAKVSETRVGQDGEYLDVMAKLGKDRGDVRLGSSDMDVEARTVGQSAAKRRGQAKQDFAETEDRP